MIADNIKNADKYLSVNPELAKVFKILAGLNADSGPGKREINDVAFVNVSSYKNKLLENCKFENHRAYADIQFIASGSEDIDVIDSAKLKVTEESYDKGDYALFENAEGYTRVHLEAGDFVIIFPGEAHRPGIAPGNQPVDVVKAVGKVKIN